ncbi:MAG: hypothetical protein QM778_26235 [Myxococcales bacterium]
MSRGVLRFFRGGLCGLVLAGCSGQAPEHARPSPTPSPNTNQPSPPASNADMGAAAAACPPLTLALTAQVSAAGIGLSVIARGDRAVRLASEVALLDGSTGKVMQSPALQLQRTCAAERCVTLEPGAELLAPSWLGLADGERCGEQLHPAQAGTYALAVRACDCSATQQVTVSWPGP